MNDLIITILLLVAGASFLGWGIYQLKTGKMVARVKQPTIDEPRQVGALFAVMGVLLFLFAVQTPTFEDKLSDSMRGATFLLSIALFTAFILYTIAYNLRSHRIFAFKSDKSIAPLIKKFYKPVSVALIIDAIIFALLFFMRIFMDINSKNIPPFPVLITIIVLSALSCIFIVYVSLKISLTYKKAQKVVEKTTKSSQKSTEKTTKKTTKKPVKTRKKSKK